MTHTEGPWAHYGDTSTELRIRINSVNHSKLMGREVARIKHDGCPTPEQYANARLIAAAPDLLDLLAMALPYVEDALASGDFKPGVVQRHATSIRELIAKVEGK